MTRKTPAPSSLRLGVLTAVKTRDGLLLSQRGDLGVWTLPGGRLDRGERLDGAAAREVWEETGIETRITRPLNLVYLAGWRRMNVLFEGEKTGGTLRGKTDETRDNRFFAVDRLPPMPLSGIVADAFAARPVPRIVETPKAALRRLRMRLGIRWLWNWIRGKPEGRYPAFDVSAAAIVWNRETQRVLTQRGVADSRVLPRVVCTGERAPWSALAARLHDGFDIDGVLSWVGVWQDAPNDRLEFVFATTVPDTPLFRAGEWTAPRNSTLTDRDAHYVEQTRMNFAEAPIWSIQHDPRVDAGDVLQRRK